MVSRNNLRRLVTFHDDGSYTIPNTRANLSHRATSERAPLNPLLDPSDLKLLKQEYQKTPKSAFDERIDGMLAETVQFTSKEKHDAEVKVIKGICAAKRKAANNERENDEAVVLNDEREAKRARLDGYEAVKGSCLPLETPVPCDKNCQVCYHGPFWFSKEELQSMKKS